jgi:hypothetical protein
MQRTQLARPPYVDPTTNIIYDTDNPEYQGYLTKQSMWLKVSLFHGVYFVPLFVYFFVDSLRVPFFFFFLSGLAPAVFFSQGIQTLFWSK